MEEDISMDMERQKGEAPRDMNRGEEGKETGKKGKGKKKSMELKGKDERIEILKKFTQEILKKHGPLVRSVVLFGSTARSEWKGKSDIDVFVIFDDTRQKISAMQKDNIDRDMVEIAKGLHPLLSVQQPYLLTEFWNMVRLGHPIVFNFIREGIAVYDKDIFTPIKMLLQMGEIKPSREAVEKYIERGPQRIKRVESAKTYMVVEDLYYAMLESAQAVLMFLGENPPRPKDAPESMRRSVVKMKLLDSRYPDWLDQIITVRKDVEHKKKNSMSGEELDDWIKKSNLFVKKMQQLIVKIEMMKRENIIEKSYAIMNETAATLLKSMNRMPEGCTDVEDVFRRELVEQGIINETYLELYRELKKLRKIVSEGKIMDLPKQDLLMQREYVRKFIREVGRVMKSRSGHGRENAGG